MGIFPMSISIDFNNHVKCYKGFHPIGIPKCILLRLCCGSHRAVPIFQYHKPPGSENTPTCLPSLGRAGPCQIDEWPCYSAGQTFHGCCSSWMLQGTVSEAGTVPVNAEPVTKAQVPPGTSFPEGRRPLKTCSGVYTDTVWGSRNGWETWRQETGNHGSAARDGSEKDRERSCYCDRFLTARRGTLIMKRTNDEHVSDTLPTKGSAYLKRSPETELMKTMSQNHHPQKPAQRPPGKPSLLRQLWDRSSEATRPGKATAREPLYLLSDAASFSRPSAGVSFCFPRSMVTSSGFLQPGLWERGLQGAWAVRDHSP